MEKEHQGTLLQEQKALRSETPVIPLTANDLELDKVTRLEAGAGDYTTKPFSLAILRARVNAQLRRGGQKRSSELIIGSFFFDFERMISRKNAPEHHGEAAACKIRGRSRRATLFESRVRHQLQLCGGEMKDVILVVLALAAVSYAAWQCIRKRQALHRLDEMLAQAMDGIFSTEQYEESILSAVEARFVRYFSASAVSAARVHEEKEAVQSLIGDISHQTKTPLANIQLYAQLLSKQPLTEQGRTCVEVLNGQTEKLKSLPEALVKASRLEAGVLASHPEPINLAPTVRRAAVQYQRAAAENGIVLTVNLPDVLPAVFDAKWTEESLCNLLDNAVKYTPTGGRIMVIGTVYELFTRIDVVDTGCGIV